MEIDLLRAVRRIPGRKVVSIALDNGGSGQIEMIGERSVSSTNKVRFVEDAVRRAMSEGGSLLVASYLDDGRAVAYWGRIIDGKFVAYRDVPHMTRHNGPHETYHGDLRVYA
jgi:hypothetical protein